MIRVVHAAAHNRTSSSSCLVVVHTAVHNNVPIDELPRPRIIAATLVPFHNDYGNLNMQTIMQLKIPHSFPETS